MFTDSTLRSPVPKSVPVGQAGGGQLCRMVPVSWWVSSCASFKERLAMKLTMVKST